MSDSFVTPWTAAGQAPLSSTISWSLLRFMSIESVMLYSHLILCHLPLLLPSIFPSIRVFSNVLAHCNNTTFQLLCYCVRLVKQCMDSDLVASDLISTSLFSAVKWESSTFCFYYEMPMVEHRKVLWRIKNNFKCRHFVLSLTLLWFIPRS